MIGADFKKLKATFSVILLYCTSAPDGVEGQFGLDVLHLTRLAPLDVYIVYDWILYHDS